MSLNINFISSNSITWYDCIDTFCTFFVSVNVASYHFIIISYLFLSHVTNRTVAMANDATLFHWLQKASYLRQILERLVHQTTLTLGYILKPHLLFALDYRKPLVCYSCNSLPQEKKCWKSNEKFKPIICDAP